MQRYTCNLDGQCEVDGDGRLSLEACQQNCRPLEGGADTKEIAYEILSFDLGEALKAAPSDRVALIRRVTGETVTPQSELECTPSSLE
jgi:hypothetical protein